MVFFLFQTCWFWIVTSWKQTFFYDYFVLSLFYITSLDTSCFISQLNISALHVPPNDIETKQCLRCGLLLNQCFCRSSSQCSLWLQPWEWHVMLLQKCCATPALEINSTKWLVFMIQQQLKVHLQQNRRKGADRLESRDWKDRPCHKLGSVTIWQLDPQLGQRQMDLKWRQRCCLVWVTLPRPQTGFCWSGYTGGDTQQLTGHDTEVCLGRRQECGVPQWNASRTIKTLIRLTLCVYTDVCQLIGQA